MTLRVLYLTGYSSEAQLSAPVIKRMQADPYFDVHVVDVTQLQTRLKSCEHDACVCDYSCPHYGNDWDIGFETVDFVVSPCDRVEMVVPTYEAFLANRPIVRIYGGIAGSGTHDDSIRHALDCFGHIHCVESEECKQNLIKAGEESWRIFVTGITHLDNVDVSPPTSPYWNRPYALLLMNPVTISEQQTITEMNAALERAIEFTKTGWVFCFQPNGDTYSEAIRIGLNGLALAHPSSVHVYKERIPRNEFLFYLSQCDLFISNSSATKYEFPALNDHGEVFNPSWRNEERTKPPKLEAGGSDRIIKALKQIDWSDKEKILRKRFRY